MWVVDVSCGCELPHELPMDFFFTDTRKAPGLQCFVHYVSVSAKTKKLHFRLFETRLSQNQNLRLIFWSKLSNLHQKHDCFTTYPNSSTKQLFSTWLCCWLVGWTCWIAGLWPFLWNILVRSAEYCTQYKNTVTENHGPYKARKQDIFSRYIYIYIYIFVVGFVWDFGLEGAPWLSGLVHQTCDSQVWCTKPLSHGTLMAKLWEYI